MENVKKETFIDKIQRVLVPLGNKVSSLKYLNAIQGMMVTLPMTFIGAFFNILANPPITQEMMDEGGFVAKIFGGWFHFAQKYNAEILAPYNVTMGLIAVFAVIGIAYKLGSIYKMKGIGHVAVALSMFLLVAAPATATYVAAQVQAAGGDLDTLRVLSALPTSYMGSGGIFTAIFVGIFSVEITHFCMSKNLVIKLPESVPPMVAQSFSSIIPLAFNVGFFYAIALILQAALGITLPEVIIKLISPLLVGVSNPFVMCLIMTFTMFMWCIGIHGMTVISPIIMPLYMQAVLGNAALAQSGEQLLFSGLFLFTAVGFGGSGGTLGLVMLAARSKSKQLRTIGKLSLVPGLFNINEPVIFGMPIMFNPLMMIPFLLMSFIMCLIQWFVMANGLCGMPQNVILAVLPLGVSSFLTTGDFRLTLIQIVVLIPLSLVIYYPFFKAYEKQLVAQEEAAELEAKNTETAASK